MIFLSVMFIVFPLFAFSPYRSFPFSPVCFSFFQFCSLSSLSNFFRFLISFCFFFLIRFFACLSVVCLHPHIHPFPLLFLIVIIFFFLFFLILPYSISFSSSLSLSHCLFSWLSSSCTSSFQLGSRVGFVDENRRGSVPTEEARSCSYVAHCGPQCNSCTGQQAEEEDQILLFLHFLI